MFKNPFSFQGRIRRTEFGLSYTIVLVCFYSLLFVVNALEINGLPILIHLAAIFWFLFSQGAKRCHDMGNSGFYQLIPFYIFAMIFNEGKSRRNKYGQDPKLIEPKEQESVWSSMSRKIIFPEEKQMAQMGSEMLSGAMLTVLMVALISYFFGPSGWYYFILHSLLIMSGYYLVLLFGYKTGTVQKSTRFFILHRALFSIICHTGIWSYEIYGHTIPDFSVSAYASTISSMVAIFTLTYIPYLIFKSKKSSTPIPVEA